MTFLPKITSSLDKVTVGKDFSNFESSKCGWKKALYEFGYNVINRKRYGREDYFICPKRISSELVSSAYSDFFKWHLILPDGNLASVRFREPITSPGNWNFETFINSHLKISK